VVDVTAPAPQITSAGGSAPSVSGTAGTGSGDAGSVTVDLFAGGAASGSPAQRVVVPRDGAGAWSAQFERVGGGTYTARARQSDAAGNSGTSSPVSFTVAGEGAPAPPAFAVVATEESLADAAGGRLTALSSCETACSRTASLMVSSRVAGRLGLAHRGAHPVRLGGGTKGAGSGAVKVGMTRKVRRALGRSDGAKATLSAVAGSVKLARAVTLRPKLSPARVAKGGLRLAGVCSSQCTMSARLIVSRSTARRLGLRASGGSVAIGSSRVDAAASSPKTFTVRVSSAARRALSRAKAAQLTLEVTVNGAGTAARRATRRVTLG
jgi:hypothetical protein